MSDCLVFFSGGRDSFLTVCKQAENRNHVHLIQFNNGSIIGSENLSHSVQRLQKRYGVGRITYEGVCSITSLYMRFEKMYGCAPLSNLVERYPTISLNQLRCLNCQSSMWIAGIAYALAKGFTILSTGYKSTDVFCTGSDFWLRHIRTLAKSYNLAIELPMWNVEDVKYEMNERGYIASVLEPKCMIGMPAKPLSTKEVCDLDAYYQDVIQPLADELIGKLVPSYKVLVLSEQPFI